MTDKKNDAPIIRLHGRLSFPSIFDWKENDDGSKRYEVVTLLPPDTDLKPILAALEKVAVETWGADRAAWPRKARKPEDVIVPATEKKYAGYDPGWHYISAAMPAFDKKGKPRDRPQVLNALRDEVTDEKEIYPGRWAKVAVRPYYFKNKSEGVTFALIAVQLLKHDTRLAGVNAKTLFDDEAEDMDDDI